MEEDSAVRARDPETGPVPFALFFERTDVAMLVACGCGRIREVNPAGCALLGEPKHVLVGRSLEELGLLGAGGESRRPGQSPRFLAGRCPDGTPRLIELGEWTDLGDAGRVALMCDVDEWEPFPATPGKSRSIVRGVVERGWIGIVLIGSDSIARYAHSSITTILGYEVADFVGRNVFDLVHPADLHLARRPFEDLLAPGREEVSAIFRVRHTDGGWRWIETVAWSLPGDAGRDLIACSFRDVTDWKDALTLLDETRMRLESFLDIAGDAIVSIDDALRIGFFSHTAEQIFHYSRDEVIGQPLDLLIPDRFAAVHRRHVAEFLESPVLNKRMDERREILCRRKDGSEFPAEATISKVGAEPAFPLTVILRDISQRRLAELALQGLLSGTAQTGAEFFRALARHLAAALGVNFSWVAEVADHRADRLRMLALWARDHLEEPLEYDAAGTPCETAIIARGLCAIEDRVQEQYPDSSFLRERNIVGFMGIPLLGSCQRVIGILCILDDKPIQNLPNTRTIVSIFAARAAAELERMRSEASLCELQEILLQAESLARIGSWEWELDTGSLKWSPEMYRQFHVSPGEVPQPTVDLTLSMIHADDVELVRSNYRNVLETGGMAPIEYRLVLPDGMVRHIRADGHLVPEEDGVPRRMRGFAQDVTEVRRLEEELRQTQKMEAIGRLAGGVAHDFNNLLTVITGYCDLILRRTPPSDRTHSDAKEIQHAGRNAAALTRQLLAFSRKQILRPAIMDLSVTVAEMGKMLRRLIGENITLRVVADASLSPITADPSQIEQVIANLVINARDAMPAGGTVTIETRSTRIDGTATGGLSPGAYVLLSVSDTGCGMDAATVAHIFEPFFTTKGVGQGTGLGLSTVYGIVTQSGGAIDVTSEVGVGTTFRVYLPAAVGEAAAHEANAPSGGVGGTETVLLVEDEAAVRRLASQTLSGWGYTVLEARDAEEALEIASRAPEPIDILVTDILMPGMSGWELAQRLGEARSDMKVLFMSGYAQSTLLERGTLDGSVEILEKPFTSDALAERIRAILDDAR